MNRLIGLHLYVNFEWFGSRMADIRRLAILNQLALYAAEKGWTVKSFLRYNLVGSVRDAAIQQAKVVINLNSVASLPTDHSDQAEELSRVPPTPLNTHRIRHLLSLGKAVISEVRS
jgi:hypothetical protein